MCVCVWGGGGGGERGYFLIVSLSHMYLTNYLICYKTVSMHIPHITSLSAMNSYVWDAHLQKGSQKTHNYVVGEIIIIFLKWRVCRVPERTWTDLLAAKVVDVAGGCFGFES